MIMPVRNIGNTVAVLMIFGMMLFVSNCEQSFEPLKENDQYFFSIYGYLDAAADTQWVRVMPIQEQLYSGSEMDTAVVSLEHLESGEKAVMKDSLFYYGHDTYARNYWTTMPLEPDETYRLTATGKEGQSSSVTVTLPEDYPTPVVQTIGDNVFNVFVDVSERLVDVQSIYRVRQHRSDVRIISVPNMQSAYPDDEGGYRVDIKVSTDRRYVSQRVTGDYTLSRAQIFVAVAGPDWVDFSVLDDRVIELPDGVSNIENGVGYLVGVVSKTIPFYSCLDDDGVLIPCPLESRLRN